MNSSSVVILSLLGMNQMAPSRFMVHSASRVAPWGTSSATSSLPSFSKKKRVPQLLASGFRSSPFIFLLDPL